MELERLAAQNPWWADRKVIERDPRVKKVLDTGSRITFATDDENKVLVGGQRILQVLWVLQ